MPITHPAPGTTPITIAGDYADAHTNPTLSEVIDAGNDPGGAITAASGGGGTGGSVLIAPGAGDGGTVTLTGGNSSEGHAGSTVYIYGGNDESDSAGAINLVGAAGATNFGGGEIVLFGGIAGAGTTESVFGAQLVVGGGHSSGPDNEGGNILLWAGDGATTDHIGGLVEITAGDGDFGGNVVIAGGDSGASHVGGDASLSGGEGDSGTNNAAQFIAKGGGAAAAGKARIYTADSYGEVGQAVVSDGSGNAVWALPSLLAVKAYASGSDVVVGSTTTSTSFVDVDATNAAVTFVAPASGNVLVRLSALHSGSVTPDYFWGLRESSSDIGTPFRVGRGSADGEAATAVIYLTGISAGSHTYKWSHRVSAANACGIYAGPTIGQIVMEVWAAP